MMGYVVTHCDDIGYPNTTQSNAVIELSGGWEGSTSPVYFSTPQLILKKILGESG